MPIYLICRKCRSRIAVWRVERYRSDCFGIPTPGELFVRREITRCPGCGKPLEPPKTHLDIEIG